jgi:uncharacterized protein (DUF302 family)
VVTKRVVQWLCVGSALLILTLTGCNSAADAKKPSTAKEYAVKRVVVPTDKSFDQVREALESGLKKADYATLEKMVAERTPAEAAKAMAALAGPSGLMILGDSDYGSLISPAGSGRKARLYQIGNPLIAQRMAAVDPAMGLYVPIRVYLYEDKGGKAWLEYDQPSSVLGQFGSADIDKVAKLVDEKFERLTRKAAE